MSRRRTYDTRRDDLAKIHIAKKDLNMEEDVYRAQLHEMFGVTSSAQLNWKQRARLLDWFISKGWEPKIKDKSRTRKVPVRKLPDDPQSKMIRALWLKLHEMGEVRDPSEQALAAFVKRQTKVERLEWLSTNQASDVIESLKQWVLRVGGEVE